MRVLSPRLEIEYAAAAIPTAPINSKTTNARRNAFTTKSLSAPNACRVRRLENRVVGKQARLDAPNGRRSDSQNERSDYSGYWICWRAGARMSACRTRRDQRGQCWSDVLSCMDQPDVRSSRGQRAGHRANRGVVEVAVVPRCAADLWLFRHRLVAVTGGCMVVAVIRGGRCRRLTEHGTHRFAQWKQDKQRNDGKADASPPEASHDRSIPPRSTAIPSRGCAVAPGRSGGRLNLRLPPANTPLISRLLSARRRRTTRIHMRMAGASAPASRGRPARSARSVLHAAHLHHGAHRHGLRTGLHVLHHVTHHALVHLHHAVAHGLSLRDNLRHRRGGRVGLRLA